MCAFRITLPFGQSCRTLCTPIIFMTLAIPSNDGAYKSMWMEFLVFIALCVCGRLKFRSYGIETVLRFDWWLKQTLNKIILNKGYFTEMNDLERIIIHQCVTSSLKFEMQTFIRRNDLTLVNDYFRKFPRWQAVKWSRLSPRNYKQIDVQSA